MNPVWLVRNIITSWRYRASVMDFGRRILFTYAEKLPRFVRKREWIIGFCYPLPIGKIRLLLRANEGSDAFIFSEVFEHEYYRLPLASPPDTILDLGANAGFTAVYFSRAYPNAQLACVEPEPENLRMLAQNLMLNEVRAVVIPAAVDIRDGRVLMELGVKDYGHKVVAEGEMPVRETIEVASLSIPTILQRLGWERIGLLKVDIEGHEKTLFSSDCDWLDRVDALCIECHEGFGKVDLVKIAAKYGFEQPEHLPGIWLLRRSSIDLQ